MARILVAEDSPTQAARLVFALEERGFEVRSARDGEQALQLYAADSFDVVISDVMMPGLTGYELCRAIKSNDVKAPVPVVLLTSLNEPMDVINGLECGADNFIRKPYATDDLVSRVDRIVANAHERRSDRLSFGLNVDFMGNRFTINSDRAQILDLLISTFEETVRANRELERMRTELVEANAKIKLYADELETRVRERTEELAKANEGLRAEIAARESTEKQLVQAQKMEAIGTLTGGIAHDFNNLLGVVIGNLDLMAPLVRPMEEAAPLYADALDAALRGADLTRRLLAFARHQPLNPERVDINQLVAGMVTLLKRVLGAHIEVELDLGADIWPAVVDPSQLESTLTNLAVNARDAMPKGGRLRFATRNRTLDADYAREHQDIEAGDFAMIAVTDTGTGMPPEIVARIFEPFFTTKDKSKGTGLGLAMVFGFMKQSRGHINVYSEVGTGTVFRLYLPRSEAEAGRARPAAVLQVPLGRGETVLAVEDNAAMRKVVALQLGALNYRVIEADGAAAAMEALEREKVDAMVSDVIMSGKVNGIELAREAMTRWPRLRVILTSGFAASTLLTDLDALGGVRVLTKPYRRDDLARELRTALGS
ncbi:MAG TPA: response regulator [Stellaceae bacterium]|nr:response regulator [Stellaceae bacterium]